MVKNTLVILGSHPGSRGEFDQERTDCDLWVFNEAPRFEWGRRASAVFQMHLPAIFRNPKNRNDPNHPYFLSNTSGSCNICNGTGYIAPDKPCTDCDGGIYTPPPERAGMAIYMLDDYQDIPGCIKYPLDQVQNMLSNFNWKRMNTSSPSYAIALGILLGYQRIELYGVEMETDTEYRYQREFIAFWTGFALGRGIEFEAHSKMFDAPLYGYEGGISLGREDFVKRMDELQAEKDRLLSISNGAVEAVNQAIDEFLRTGVDGNLNRLIGEQLTAAGQFGTVYGAMSENKRYIERADTMLAASGECIIVRQEFEQAANNFARKREEVIPQANILNAEMKKAWEHVISTSNKRKRIERVKNFVALVQQSAQAAVNVGALNGAVNENARYMSIMDSIIRAAGGSKSEELLMESARPMLEAVQHA